MPYRTLPPFDQLQLPDRNCHVLLVDPCQHPWMDGLSQLLRKAQLRVVYTTSQEHARGLQVSLQPLITVSSSHENNAQPESEFHLLLHAEMEWSTLLDQLWLQLSRWHQLPAQAPQDLPLPRPPAPTSSGSEDEHAHAVLRYVEWNMEAFLSDAQVTQALRLDAAQLHQALQQLGVTSIAQLQHRLRMQRAQQLIMHSKLPIAGIAMALGFHDLPTFNRAMRQFTGLKPEQLRDLYRPKS